jgi:anti-sigma B factor antagonist
MPEQVARKGFDLYVVLDGDTPTVKCSGRLVAGVNDRLYREVVALIPNSKRVILDFTDVTHMDSSGLGTLVRLYVHAKSSDAVIELMNPGKSIKQLLGITHMMSVFQMIGENNIRMG